MTWCEAYKTYENTRPPSSYYPQPPASASALRRSPCVARSTLRRPQGKPTAARRSETGLAPRLCASYTLPSVLTNPRCLPGCRNYHIFPWQLSFSASTPQCIPVRSGNTSLCIRVAVSFDIISDARRHTRGPVNSARKVKRTKGFNPTHRTFRTTSTGPRHRLVSLHPRA